MYLSIYGAVHIQLNVTKGVKSSCRDRTQQACLQTVCLQVSAGVHTLPSWQLQASAHDLSLTMQQESMLARYCSTLHDCGCPEHDVIHMLPLPRLRLLVRHCAAMRNLPRCNKRPHIQALPGCSPAPYPDQLQCEVHLSTLLAEAAPQEAEGSPACIAHQRFARNP